MRWLTLIGQLVAFAGAVTTVLYPFERLKGLIGEIREGVFDPDGPPPWRLLFRQPRQLRGGLALMALGLLFQFVGTLCGL